jgi:hypothetical protein
MTRGKTVAYWVATTLLVFSILSGGLAEFLQVPGNVQGIVLLGYPTYFISLIGLWKVLGAIAISAPRFPRLKEWAYAGIFFNVTGAAASHVIMGDYGAYAFHVVVDLVLAALVIVSWALRPPSRVLGTIFPESAPLSTASI